MKNKIVLLALIMLFTVLSYAQNPKYYIAQFENSVNEPLIIYSIDLITGQKEILFSKENKIYSSIVLSDQSRIFFRAQRKICVYNTETQTIDTLSHLGNIERFRSISLIPSTNEIFLGFIKENAKIISREFQLLEVTNVSIDKDTYALIDTIGPFGAVDAVLSRSGNKVFQLKETTDGIYFRTFTVRSDNFERDSLAIEGFENLQLTYPPNFIAANNGYVFTGYYKASEQKVAHYAVLDPENDKDIFDSKNIKTFGLTPYPISLTNNGDMIWQDKDNFYVLSHKTGKLRKRLKFHFNEPTTDPHILVMTQNAKLLIIGETLYYFPKNPNVWKYSQLWTYEVGSGNINEDQTDEDLLDLLLEDPDELYQNGWIENEQTRDKYNTLLGSTQTYLAQGDIRLTKSELEKVLTECSKDSLTNITIEAYALLSFNAKELLDRLPEEQTNPYLTVKLEDSENSLLQNGFLQYYENGWKDAVDNGDGTFTVNTEQNSVSLRMNYEYASQTISNVSVTSDTFAFQTVNTQVELRDSEGNLINDEATVKYYSGGWREFGTTINGVAEKELLPNNYSFRMNYAFASNDKKQDTEINPVVVFQTVNTQVQLQDSRGNPITEEAAVKYYSGGWRDFGTTVNGVAEKELLPNNYSFRMNYAFASNDKKQDTNVDPVVVFQTVNTQVQLQDSQDNPITEEAAVKYYSGGWRDFGTTVNGVAEKELLPNNYSFRMNYAFASNDKKQDTEVDPVVIFQTVNTQVQLQDSQGNPINDEANVKYYSGGWRDFGLTVNGVAEKELLPNNYSFRMNYAFASNDKKQDTEVDPVVVFQTVNTQVQLQNSQGNPITEEATVKYYSGGWRDFGTTVNGVAEKELLPNNYSFRMNYAFASNDKKQDTEVNPVIVFQTENTQVELRDSEGNPIIEEASVKYYSGGWRDFGMTVNGIVEKELLPNNYSFRMSYAFISNDKKQDVGADNIVTFSTMLCTVSVEDQKTQPIDNAVVRYYAGGWRDFGNTVNGIVTKELLPANISFRATYNSVQEQKQQDISSNSTVEFILNITE